MKAAVLHGIASLKLHSLVFITVAKSSSVSIGSNIRLQQLAERYSNMASSLEDKPDQPGVAIDDLSVTPADLPAFDDLSNLVDWQTYKGDGQITWALSLVNSEFKDLPNTRISAKTLWEFYTLLTKRYPDAPRGLISWAAYGRKGDGAAFFQKSTNRTFHLTIE